MNSATGEVEQTSRRADPAPFLKWAGGKSQLREAILDRLPARIDHYFEPFLGGGAIFFALAAQGRFERAVLADRNEALLETYRAVRNEVDAVIEHLREHRYEKEHFYRVRALEPAELSLPARAARIIYLNRTCYNGLYRVNRAGRFNVPFGRYSNPTICDEAGLRLASEALGRAELVCGDFEAVVGGARPGDAVYFDPPYYPLSPTSSFTSYDQLPFGPPEHRRLDHLLRRLVSRGIPVLLSNSDCPFTRDLFVGLEVESVQATRAINSVGGKRGTVSELLVYGGLAGT